MAIGISTYKCIDCKGLCSVNQDKRGKLPLRCPTCRNIHNKKREKARWANKNNLLARRDRERAKRASVKACKPGINVTAKCPKCGGTHVIKQREQPIIMPRVYCTKCLYLRESDYLSIY